MVIKTYSEIASFPTPTPQINWSVTRLCIIAVKAAGIDDYRMHSSHEEINMHFRDAGTKKKFVESYETAVSAQDRLNKPFTDASEQAAENTAELTALDPMQFVKSRDWDLKIQIAFPKYTSADAEAKMANIVTLLRQAASETAIDVYIGIRRPTPENRQQYVINVFAARDADMADFDKAYRRLSAENPPEPPKPVHG